MLDIQIEAQEAAGRLAEERRKALAEAVALALEQRVERYRLAIIEDHLILRCPRCLKAFVDYDACDAVTCGNCGCGFCALCLRGQCCICAQEPQRSTIRAPTFASFAAWH
jgi:hypothetical protein